MKHGAAPLTSADEDILALLQVRHYLRAFETLLPRYRDRVFRLCWSILENRELAEESAQDAFIRIWKALPAFRRDSSLSTWIFSIARNTSLTTAKHNARRGLSLDDPANRREAELVTHSESHELGHVDVPHLLAQLPEKYRRVIALFYMEEKSYEEVSRMLDLPMGTVKTYLHRARKELAAALIEARIEEGVGR